MGTCIQPATARTRRRLVRLAAAAAGLTARTAAAETPLDPLPIEAPPRTHPIQSSYETWVGFTAMGAIHAPILAFVDLAAGFQADMHPAGVVVRPAVGVRLPHGFSVFAGYSYASFWDTAHERGEEHVVFQQVGYQAPFSAVGLFGRIREEERFRAGSDVGIRLRALVLLSVPFWQRSPLQAVVSNEVFLGLNQPGDWQPAVMDQDQLYAGLGWVPDPHFRADLGYQAAVVPRPDETSIVHSLSIGTTAFW